MNALRGSAVRETLFPRRLARSRVTPHHFPRARMGQIENGLSFSVNIPWWVGLLGVVTVGLAIGGAVYLAKQAK